MDNLEGIGMLDATEDFTRQLRDAFGCFASGLANGAFWSLTPVYAAAVGDVTKMAAGLMAAAVVGGAISQWPAMCSRDKPGKVSINTCTSRSPCWPLRRSGRPSPLIVST